MTSEIETKTNEFLRRRKLRLQQVREQSKDIAKKIRQRASYEQIRQAAGLGGQKERIYLKHQENLINHLEKLYRNGIQNVGASHKNASDVTLQQDKVPGKPDLSKLRGKEAIAELRKRKQQKLDEQKKLLDQKLQAREAANELSREKSSAVANKLAANDLPITDQNLNVSNIEGNKLPITRSDMATQWDIEHPSVEWEPVPPLALPNDDQETEKVITENSIDKNKRLDLFAISEEMPSSLRGGLTQNSEARPSVRPALNMVSEYLQNRDLRLRQPDTVPKKPEGDLHNIKQTILRSRSTKAEAKSNLIDATSKSSLPDTGLSKKNSVTMYNHLTRDSRDIPRNDNAVVIRDAFHNEDAYSQALKESAITLNNDKEQQKRLQTMRNKVAMTKHSVEKEYKDTMAFLNSLPSDKHRPIKTAFMDDQQQHVRKEKCQNKLQQEFKRIERECRSDSSKNSKTVLNRSRSKTPTADGDNDFVAKDFQYSWMPVPESDNNLAIHTIPTTLKEAKSGNTVKFSQVDSYHEYRSRHKHTPPTKDTNCRHKHTNKRKSQEKNDDSTDTSQSSIASDTSSVENLRTEIKSKHDRKKKSMTDAEKIIIYKVLDSSNEKNIKESTKLLSEIAKSLTSLDKEKGNSTSNNETEIAKASLEHIEEGIYKTARDVNGDNMSSLSIPKDTQNVSNEKELTSSYSRKCGCHKKKQDCSDKGDVSHNTTKSSTSPRPKSCKCKAEIPPVSQSLAATSTSSFTTANDKQNCAYADSDYIKLIGEGGEDTGRFYIGGSGFLKDEAYEVVIQLRKKDAPKYSEIQVSNQKAQSTNETETNAVPIVNATEDKSAHATDDIPYKVSDIKIDLAQAENYVDNAVQSTANNLTDKAVGTSFQEVMNVCSRPISTATSTFTQTTFCSPQHRPMLIHMSSSTSTAYMSPPELILPHFLKQDYKIPYEEVCESPQSQETNVRKRHCTCDNSDCSCDLVPRINLYSKTPPNTCRSTESEETRNIKKRDRKHDHRKSCKACVKCHRHVDCKYSQTTRRIRKVESIMKTRPINYNRPKLDPSIKKYVNKLLELNKDGLNAINVFTQDCSSVTTPGSSVIGIPTNFSRTEKAPEKTLSLELIKEIINQQLLETLLKTQSSNNKSGPEQKPKFSIPRKKSMHKVKSLNISKQLTKPKYKRTMKACNIGVDKMGDSSSTSTKEQNTRTHKKLSRKSSLSPRKFCSTTIEQSNSNNESAVATDPLPLGHQKHLKSHTVTTTSCSTDNEILAATGHQKHINLNAIARGSQSSDTDFTKVAEDKLLKMEKIADLTEKCTKRLSNLAKVLEEVRKNKSLAYNHLSTSESTSDSDHKSDKSASTRKLSVSPEVHMSIHEPAPPMGNIEASDNIKDINTTQDSLRSAISNFTTLPIDGDKITSFERNVTDFQLPTSLTVPSNFLNMKPRAKPPPALSRINLKNDQTCIIPHELSTVMEVDSPMSVKVNTNQSSPKGSNEIDEFDRGCQLSRAGSKSKEVLKEQQVNSIGNKAHQTNPDLLESNLKLSKSVFFADSVDETKLQMMDLNKFNEIMLKPFISINEFAKHCNNEQLDEGSVIDDLIKENQINDDFSSLHSDGSLPDVIAELLKRNIISEPFQFDKSSGSNVNSTSESTSVLALSKGRKERNKYCVIFQNKENLPETSDTMSISSNPDLENAFKKLGMGWASSTLKKTKERLALSSSSNTSSSTSLSQFKVKSFSQEPPALVTDSVSLNLSMSKRQPKGNTADFTKNVEQQTTLINSMTVKEFLTNELAKKITFSYKSDRNDTEDEFVSLVETKLPDELKYSQNDQQSMGSVRSGTNRARTSTPVQLFKSVAYQSSSSSNMSNGLFSNADELSSVKGTSNSMRNHSTSDKDDLTIPNYSLRFNRGVSDCSKSD